MDIVISLPFKVVIKIISRTIFIFEWAVVLGSIILKILTFVLLFYIENIWRRIAAIFIEIIWTIIELLFLAVFLKYVKDKFQAFKRAVINVLTRTSVWLESKFGIIFTTKKDASSILIGAKLNNRSLITITIMDGKFKAPFIK